MADNKRPKEAIEIIQESLEAQNARWAEHRISPPKTRWSPNDRLIHAQTEVILGEAFRHDGQLASARQHIAVCLVEIGQMPPKEVDASFVIFTLARAAEVELEDKNLNKSLEFNDKALNLLKNGIRVAPEKVQEVLKQRGQILHALGKHAEARQVEEKLKMLPK